MFNPPKDCFWLFIDPSIDHLNVFSSYKKKDGDLAVALARIKELEAQYNKNEAALNTALSENKSLSAELADLKAQLAKVSPSMAFQRPSL